ncbi:2-dehydropantoate 2-reductase [Aaosphaeria arxii CBS 175.79]|uniref:2-dehydropantoate 2-reductase n=1 Tax=Aaosphaeria arxii CBS 175.79 TaxID=1450172 RepID=A0A6A5XHU7_9PLEO|nr:2-dehydropantoate 2-reductase [Aaosphaeria arxii CBS 175.79]KAF2012692.1 2-dehydropantoate 2-reductase [Aaosphaeria arxii CBS 175.79]
MSQSPIHILGIGNLGKLLANSLRKAHPELPITLLFHRRNLLQEWDEAGRNIEIVRNGSPDKRSSFDHEFIDGDDKGVGEIANLIVTTKTHSTTRAMKPLVQRLGQRSTVLFCQNGLGTVDEVTNALFPKPESRPSYLAGIFNHGVYSTSTFSSVHAGLANAFIGPIAPDSAPSPTNLDTTIPTLAQHIIECPELSTTFVSPQDLLEIQFQKLVVNAVINPLTAILDCYNGELFQSADIRVLISLLISELSAVIIAILSSKTPTSTASIQEKFSPARLANVVNDVGARTAKNISSMRQDALAGRKTEIDYINGYIVRQGQRLGIPVPVNEKIEAFVRENRKVDKEGVLKAFEIVDQ